MNGIRCTILLDSGEHNGVPWYRYQAWYGRKSFTHIEPFNPSWRRIFGSHSEAKRELKHWTDSYPDARIVDEVDL